VGFKHGGPGKKRREKKEGIGTVLAKPNQSEALAVNYSTAGSRGEKGRASVTYSEKRQFEASLIGTGPGSRGLQVSAERNQRWKHQKLYRGAVSAPKLAKKDGGSATGYGCPQGSERLEECRSAEWYQCPRKPTRKGDRSI